MIPLEKPYGSGLQDAHKGLNYKNAHFLWNG